MKEVISPNDFKPVIGLEVHAQILTESKLFCGCKAAFGQEPNSLTCPVCLGLPGTLPVLNKKAVEFAIKLIIAVGGNVNQKSLFARKNYFYPDLPKGYQITQYDIPLGEGGTIVYKASDGQEKRCRIKRIHIEEDAGKLIHYANNTAIDFNRSGIPLLEIVTEPDIENPDEAYGYLVTLKQILQYLGVCTCDMEKGHLRCDANISLRPNNSKQYGTRIEIKNLNSFKSVEKALYFEIKRQKHLLHTGEIVKQETLLWDENIGMTEPMRLKEESDDYRYFTEPDLIELYVADNWLSEIIKTIKELPEQKKERFIKQYGIREYDATVLTASNILADFYEKVTVSYKQYQYAANWILNELLGCLNDNKILISDCLVKPINIANLLTRIESGELSQTSGKEVLYEMIKSGNNVDVIISSKSLTQISDEQIIEKLLQEIIEKYPEKVIQYQSGKVVLFDFFVGQAMRATAGKANPEVVNRLLKDILKVR